MQKRAAAPESAPANPNPDGTTPPADAFAGEPPATTPPTLDAGTQAVVDATVRAATDPAVFKGGAAFQTVADIEEAVARAAEYLGANPGGAVLIDSATPLIPEAKLQALTGSDVLRLIGPESTLNLASIAVAKVIDVDKFIPGDGNSTSAQAIGGRAECVVVCVANLAATIYNKSRGLEAPAAPTDTPPAAA